MLYIFYTHTQWIVHVYIYMCVYSLLARREIEQVIESRCSERERERYIYRQRERESAREKDRERET